jgi:hypothetical protein
MPDDANGKLIACPRCGYCLDVPSPWDKEAENREDLRLFICPSRQPGLSQEQRRVRYYGSLIFGCIILAIVGVLIGGAVTMESLAFQFIAGSLACWFLFGLTQIVGRAVRERREKDQGSGLVVHLPEDRSEEIHQLGRPICAFLGKPKRKALFEFFCMLPLPFAGYGFYLMLQENAWEADAIVFLVALPVALACIIYRIRCWMIAPEQVVIFSRGVGHMAANTIKMLRWSQITAVDVSQGEPGDEGLEYTVTVRAKHGQRLVIEQRSVALDLWDFQRLLEILQSHETLATRS